MAFSRYSFTRKINVKNKTIIGTSRSCKKIYRAVLNGGISTTTHILKEGERLDTISQIAYGDSYYWWVLAAASGIGWSLQVPPGTVITIPTNLDIIVKFL